MSHLHQWFVTRFAEPLALIGIVLAIPAFLWAHAGAGRVVFSSLRALPAGGVTWRTRFAWLPDLMLALAVASLAIALAGPRKGDKNARVHHEGIGVVMAVDISGSMRALDLSEKNQELTRLDAVKKVFEQFVLGGNGLEGRDDDAIGLVAFARFADTRSPLTLDHNNLVAAAKALDFAREDEDGTAIGAGLELAVQRLVEYTHVRSKIVVLLTDGVSNVHDIDEDTAIDDAVKAHVKVYTIGAGTNGVAPIRVDRGDGATQLMQMPVEIDERLLRRIADKTGGQYFRATDHDSLAQIYKQIDKLERSKLDEEKFLEYSQYYGYFVGAALGLIVLALLLRGSVLRRLP